MFWVVVFLESGKLPYQILYYISYRVSITIKFNSFIYLINIYHMPTMCQAVS